MGAAYGQSGAQSDGQSGSQRPRTVDATKSGSGGAERTERGSPQVIVYGDDDYKIAPRDVIEIIVEDAPELSVNYTVNSKGVVPLRFLGAASVAGKTTEEVSKIISDGLRGRYLQDPKVYVSVKQYNSRTFFIQGAVRNPGVYVVSGRPSLFRLMSIAGGLMENHGLVAYIFRETPAKPEKLETGSSQNSGDSKIKEIINEVKGEAKGTAAATVVEGEPDYKMITASIGGMLRGRLDNNVVVQPGDVVYVPPADVFYVAGEVREPGQFRLRQGITLRQAISLAGGTLFKARLGKGVIFRNDPVTGNFTELPVDIGAVMSGKGQDMPIEGNDVIWVPNSSAKSVGATVINAMIPYAIYRIP
jgi:polysaccharide biosynthesis/export protein